MNIRKTFTYLSIALFLIGVSASSLSCKKIPAQANAAHKHKHPATKPAPRKHKKKAKARPSCHKHHPKHAVKQAPKPLPGNSIYQLTSTWTTQHNKKIKLSHLKGKVWVVAMVYTSCRHTCPVIVSDMKNIEKQFTKEQLKRIGFMLVSIDPKRDTPKNLLAFSKKANMAQDRWVLLHGKDDQILELAAVLGVRYKKTSAKDYAHSNLISIIDQKGLIKYRQVGLLKPPKHAAMTVKGLLKKKAKSHKAHH